MIGPIPMKDCQSGDHHNNILDKYWKTRIDCILEDVIVVTDRCPISTEQNLAFILERRSRPRRNVPF